MPIMERENLEEGRSTVLDLARAAAENGLVFAVGVSPSAVLASIAFTWAAVRPSLAVPHFGRHEGTATGGQT